VLLVASANPEDYTNRGRIITPLKDRFGAEIRTHYPLRLEDEVASSARRRTWSPRCPTTCSRSSPGSPAVRESTAVDQRSGCLARFAIAAAETLAASALRRAA
jgi:magnesium chelatase subunit I